MLLHHPICHVGYVVEDIEEAVASWVRLTGAGPFLLLDHLRFDSVEHRGRHATFEHSAAFGQYGPIAVELQQIHVSAPPSLTEAIVPGRPPVINHVAVISATPEEDSAALTAAGHPLFLHARAGEVEVRFHDTKAVLGQAIEIHRRSEFIEGFFADVAALARGWDGSDPLRRMPPRWDPTAPLPDPDAKDAAAQDGPRGLVMAP